MTRLIRTVLVEQPQTAISVLTAAVPELSKGRLKDAMAKGAVMLLSKPQKRLRRVQAMLRAGDKISLHYDDDLLQRQCPPPQLLADERQYSIWFKPAGMLSQGNEWGDHLALLRAAEQFFQPARQVYLVHRLDREASGLVIIAHTKHAAAAFSQRIAERAINKDYLIRVKGALPDALLSAAVLNMPLDGKDATTRFSLRRYDAITDSSWLDVELITGRKHQIRRHFSAAGYPVIGDPQYGHGSRQGESLALQAVRLGFVCPVKRRAVEFSLPQDLQIIQVAL